MCCSAAHVTVTVGEIYSPPAALKNNKPKKHPSDVARGVIIAPIQGSKCDAAQCNTMFLSVVLTTAAVCMRSNFPKCKEGDWDSPSGQTRHLQEQYLLPVEAVFIKNVSENVNFFLVVIKIFLRYISNEC